MSCLVFVKDIIGNTENRIAVYRTYFVSCQSASTRQGNQSTMIDNHQ
ncbi:MAG: hypothetical protein ACI8RD_005865 [Bacillariaceae sp.]